MRESTVPNRTARLSRATVLTLAASLCWASGRALPASGATGAQPSSPTPGSSTIAPGVELVAGHFEPGRQPDGNTTLFSTTSGWIVVDTGRHEAHQARILDRVKASGRPILAVVNTHWHLDHVGGNPRLRAAHPGLRVYSSDAIRGALGGFLADYRSYLEAAVAKSDTDPETARRFRAELAILAAGEALGPDEVVRQSAAIEIGGKALRLELVGPAATAGDIWLFDPATGTLVAGDLVTLPAPFLDTACPEGWRRALDTVAGVDFARLVPGHGPVLDRAGFERYRKAFGRFLDCGKSTRPKTECSADWFADLGPLLPEAEHASTLPMLDYYLEDVLRGDPKRAAALCAP